jgi:isopentenyldiphosphate isomerase
MRGATRDAARAIVPDERPARRIAVQSGQMTNSMQLNPAQDPGEPFDVITADGRPTGRVKTRAEIHRDGDWHRAIHVWVAGVDDRGRPFLTFQRRSPQKDTWPARYDATVGGHYRAGETLTETVREVEEEIGIIPDLRELRPLGVRVCANEAQPGIVDREIQDLFLLRDDRPLENFRPNPAELASLVRFPLEILVPFLAGERGEIDGESLAPEATRAEPITARSDDFIPTVDRYFLRIAIAAQQVLRGERYVAV